MNRAGLGGSLRTAGLSATLFGLTAGLFALGYLALRRFQGHRRLVGEPERDVVEEASWESFPASDAPPFQPRVD